MHDALSLIPGAPEGATGSWRCDNGAVYDRFDPEDVDGPFVRHRYRWERRTPIDGCCNDCDDDGVCTSGPAVEAGADDCDDGQIGLGL